VVCGEESLKIRALLLAMILVTAMFAGIPVTSWLLARFVSPAWRARAYSLEYAFSLGVSSLVIPVLAYLHSGPNGFARMFGLLACAAAVVASVAAFLPNMRQKTPLPD
jgi:hypothetical protein